MAESQREGNRDLPRQHTRERSCGAISYRDGHIVGVDILSPGLDAEIASGIGG